MPRCCWVKENCEEHPRNVSLAFGGCSFLDAEQALYPPVELEVEKRSLEKKGLQCYADIDRHTNLNISMGTDASGVRDTMRIRRANIAIKETIKNQLQDDIMNDQISVKKFNRPVCGCAGEERQRKNSP